MNTKVGDLDSVPYSKWHDENSKEKHLIKDHKVRLSAVPIKDYESLDYNRCYNVPYKKFLDGYSNTTYLHVSLMRWILVGVIGFLTGLTAFLINIGVYYLRSLKFNQFHKVYDLLHENGMIFLGLLVLIGFNSLYGFIAAMLVVFEPIAAGSGIPEIKCYLNGINMPRVGRIKTLIAKACGVLFSVAGGFLVGKEGPMIHSGAIIGSGIPQLRSFLWKKLKLPYAYFRSDKDKRDFVSCGAAAGVAAAFGAPIGGVLFSLEEGSSFWDQGLTWRSLFCAMCSTLTLNLFLSASPLVPNAKFGELDRPGLINFGRFDDIPHGNNLWTVQYIFVFAAMGAFGGLMGAWFNSLNKHLTIYRMNHVFTKRIAVKVLETILIAIVTTVSVFILATLLGTCVPVIDIFSNQGFAKDTLNFFCPLEGIMTKFGGTHFTEYYNDMATLVFNSEEDSIRQLFHQNGAFTLATLGLALIVFFFIACWTYGAGIPSGLFVPCLTIGALYGRFIVTALIMLGWTPKIYAGTFALIGAAAFLGGVVRMTVSLTVILIESTDEIEYGLPLLVTLMIAKWVGDLFNEGVYDIHIELKEIPFLGWGSPECMNRLSAADVMNRDLKFIYPITRVQSIEQLLRTTAHNAFFVVTPLSLEHWNNPQDDKEQTFLPKLYKRKSIHPIHHLRRRDVKNFQAKTKPSRYERKRKPLPVVREEGGIIEEKECLAPVEENDAPLVLKGIILRSQLVTLLSKRVFFDEDNGPESQPEISHCQLNNDYPRYKTVFNLSLTQEQKNALMDVSLYMNPCPYTVSHHAPLPLVFNIFRTMGLRHLPVLEDAGIVVGMITRHDLTHEHLHDTLHRKKCDQQQTKGQSFYRVIRTGGLDDGELEAFTLNEEDSI